MSFVVFLFFTVLFFISFFCKEGTNLFELTFCSDFLFSFKIVIPRVCCHLFGFLLFYFHKVVLHFESCGVRRGDQCVTWRAWIREKVVEVSGIIKKGVRVFVCMVNFCSWVGCSRSERGKFVVKFVVKKSCPWSF